MNLSGHFLRRRLQRGALVLAGLALLWLGLVTVLCLKTTESQQAAAQRSALVRLSGLPDAALAHRSPGIRHRSLADLASQFGDHPELNEHDPASAIWAPPGRWRQGDGQ